MTSDVVARVSVSGRSLGACRAHITDADRSFTEIPLLPDESGALTVKMQPSSFAMIEF